MKTEDINNSEYYKYSEKSIKNKNLNLWNNVVGYVDYELNFKAKFYMYENLIKIIPICECGNKLKFIDMKSGFRDFCSRRCMFDSDDIKDKKKSTNLIKYGVDNPSKSEITKNKVRKTNLEKFGVEYPLQSEDIKNKLKSFFMEKWGVDNPSKIKEVRDKAENTMLERFGVKYALQSKVLLDKLKNTNFIKYGNESFTKTESYNLIMKKLIFEKNSNIVNTDDKKLLKLDKTEYTINCIKCQEDFIIQRQLWRNRNRNLQEICLVCNPIVNGVSKEEKNILFYIKEIYNGEIVENYRLENKEIDIYIPSLKIGFEYNGLYWHSELNKNKNYHYDKMKFFSDNNINIIQIWEDDWMFRKDIIKSMISNKLGLSDRIFARKCNLKLVSNQETRSFLTDNHIQGFLGSKVKIGLYYNNELVSLMTFGSLRKSLGHNSKDNVYELLRFCNKVGKSVVGGASKLFNYFIKKFEFDEILSFSLNSYSTGNLYRELNFKFKGETGVNYFWCKNGIRYHRFNFRKDKLISEGYDKNQTEVEIMTGRNYFRLFDCGSKKFIYIK